MTLWHAWRLHRNDIREGDQAIEQAERSALAERFRAARAKRVAAELREERIRNHFAERLAKALED